MGLLDSFKNMFSFKYNILDGAPALTRDQDRGLALGAMYAVEGHLPINALTMEADPRTAAKLSKGAWDTVDAETARETYRFLLGGGHQSAYGLILPYLDQYLEVAPGRRRSEIKAVNDRAASELPALAARHGLDPDMVKRSFTNCTLFYGYIWAYGQPSGPLPRSIVAWDTARVVHVSRIFLDAGFVEPAEAWSMIAQAVDLARPSYASWADFNEGFLTGRAFWQLRGKRYNQEQIKDDGEKFSQAADELLSRDDSPWNRLPW